MHKTYTLLLAALVSLSLVSCSGDAEDNGEQSDVIKIGHFASTTGKQATFGLQVDNGVRLAMEEINERGGVLGRKVDVVTEDTQSKTDQSITAVESLIDQGVVALIGEVASSNSIAAAPIAEREQIPMVSPASTNPDVTVNPTTGETRPWVFRICFIDPFQGAGLASFTYNQLDAKRVAVLIDKANAYSVGLAQGFQNTFGELGGQIVVEQTYEGGQQDFRAQLTDIRSQNPDAIFLPGYYTEVSLIAQQARDLGITVPLVGGDGWDSPELTKGAAKQALEGAYFSNHYSEEDTSPDVQEFIKKYQARFNELPGAMSALGYDAMMIVANVIEQTGSTDPETIRQALEDLADYAGVTGLITINDEHNAEKPMVILQIRDGAFTYNSTVMADGTVRSDAPSGTMPADSANAANDTMPAAPGAPADEPLEAPGDGEAPVDTTE